MSRRQRTRYYQRRKRLIIGIAIICCVLLIATSIVYVIASNQSKPVQASSDGLEEAQIQALQQEYGQDHEFGTTKTITKQSDNFFCVIHYPYLGIQAADSLIQEQIDSIIKNYVSPYTNEKPQTPVQLDVQYKSYFINTAIGSILLEGTLYRPEESRPETFRKPLLINLKKGTIVETTDIFGEGYLTVLAQQCEEQLESSPKYQEAQDQKLLKEGISAKQENYGNLAFTDSGVSVFFKAGQVMPKTMGAIEITVPYDALANTMKIAYQTVKATPGEYNPQLAQSEEPKEPEPSTTTAPMPSESNKNDEKNEPSASKTVSKNELLSKSNRKIDPDKPMIALTFDDGPRKDVTPKVLSVLKKYNGAATFFMVGNRIRGHEDILKQMVDQGSELANHTWEHKVLTELDAKGMKEQIEKTNDAAEKATGVRPKLVRPPQGKFNQFVKDNAGHLLIGWTVDTEDWRHKDPKKTLAAVKKDAFDGAIILMHDIQESTAESVEPVVKWLTDQGYQLVTVSELLQYSDKKIELGNYYRKQ